jgi:hypothetical protein
MTLTEQISALQTPAKHLLQGLYDAFADAIVIPNSYLPERLHSKRGRTVADLMKPPTLTPQEIAKLELAERQLEKDLRVESYSTDIASEREIRYHEDELRLYKNQMTFAKLIGMEFDE